MRRSFHILFYSPFRFVSLWPASRRFVLVQSSFLIHTSTILEEEKKCSCIYCAYAPCYKFTMYKRALNILPIFRLPRILQHVCSVLCTMTAWRIFIKRIMKRAMWAHDKNKREIAPTSVCAWGNIVWMNNFRSSTSNAGHIPAINNCAPDAMMEYNSDGSIAWRNSIECEFRLFSIIRPAEWKMIIMAFIIRLNRAMYSWASELLQQFM